MLFCKFALQIIDISCDVSRSSLMISIRIGGLPLCHYESLVWYIAIGCSKFAFLCYLLYGNYKCGWNAAEKVRL